MKMKPTLVLVILELILCGTINSENLSNNNGLVSADEERLIKEIFTNNEYDDNVRPIYNASQNVEIGFAFTLVQIMDMDWVDERLTWDPDDYNGLKVIRIPADLLWLPDIVLYNNADDYTTGYMPCNAMVKHTGEVFWGPPARLRSSCKVDITFFPFDIQKCSLKFGSWTYIKEQVDIINRSPEVDLSNYVSNGEWQLTKYDIVRRESTFPGLKGVYPDITIVLVINRRVLYHVMNILMPCVWLSILNLLNFCLPPDECEKITLGITVFLSYSVFMLLVADSMPPTSEFVPLIGMYLTLSMAVACASVILTVLVLKTYHVSPNQREVPRWVRTLILQGLGRITRCERIPVKKIKRRLSTKHTFQNAVQRMAAKVQQEKSPEEKKHLFGMGFVALLAAARAKKEADAAAPTEEVAQASPKADAISTVSSIRNTAIDDILNYLKLIVSQSEEETVEDDTIDEWRQVALVIDRLLFWIFLAINFVSTLIILFVTPSFAA